MPVCDCCRRDKPDVKIRVGLRGVDNRRKNAARPFHCPLCNDWWTGRFGSAEQRWLLHQIMQASAYRIDRLSAPEKELLQTLAVVGREFTLKLGAARDA